MVDQSENDEIEPTKDEMQQQSQAAASASPVADDEHDFNETPVQSASGTYLKPQSPKPPRDAFHITALGAPSTPTSHASSRSSPAPSPRAPEPPRWRFTEDRKRAAGYDSSAAGMVVDGLSAEELGAKYVPPEIDFAPKEKEEMEIGKLKIDEKTNDGAPEGLRSCLRSFICSGAVTDSDDDNDIGDVEVGSDWDKKSAIECAVVSDDEVSNQDSTKGDEGFVKDQNKKRKACLLSLLLVIALLGMILGVTLSTQDLDEEIQSSEAIYLSKETETNGTTSPSPTQNKQLLASSEPQVNQSMVRINELKSNQHLFSWLASTHYQIDSITATNRNMCTYR